MSRQERVRPPRPRLRFVWRVRLERAPEIFSGRRGKNHRRSVSLITEIATIVQPKETPMFLPHRFVLAHRFILAALVAAITAAAAPLAHADDFSVGTSSATVSNSPRPVYVPPPPRPAAVAAVRG